MLPVRLYRVLLAGFVALLVLAPAASTRAAAKEVFSAKASGQAATVYFSSYDSCVYTYAYLNPVDGAVKTSDGRSSSSSIWGYVEQYDYCSWSYTGGYLYGDLDPDAFQSDKQLNTATLNASVFACYWDCVPVTLNLSWTGTGDTVSGKANFATKGQEFSSKSSYDATWRGATVTGTVVFPTQTINVDSSGTIESVKSSSTYIYKS